MSSDLFVEGFVVLILLATMFHGIYLGLCAIRDLEKSKAPSRN